MWPSYWGLNRDPFAEREPTHVALPGQDEAVARLVHVVESGHRWGLLCGGPGLGKTRVLRSVLEGVRSPTRRLARVTAPIDGPSLYAQLAGVLGTRVPGGASRSAAWAGLQQSVRRCAILHQQVILCVDESDGLRNEPDRADFLRLGSLGEACNGRVTVLAALEDGRLDEVLAMSGLTIRLRPLLLSEARHYLEGKLAAAGCSEPLFSDRAVSRLHLLAAGNPRGLDRLAWLCLMTAASRGLEAVPSDLVDALASDLGGRLPLMAGAGWSG